MLLPVGFYSRFMMPVLFRALSQWFLAVFIALRCADKQKRCSAPEAAACNCLKLLKMSLQNVLRSC